MEVKFGRFATLDDINFILDATEKLPKKIANKIIAVIEKEIGAEIVRRGKSSTLFNDRSKSLRKSIEFRKRRGVGHKARPASVAAASPYAHLVEFGFTHRSGALVAPRPFLRTALKEGLARGQSNGILAARKTLDREIKKLKQQQQLGGN